MKTELITQIGAGSDASIGLGRAGKRTSLAVAGENAGTEERLRGALERDDWEMPPATQEVDDEIHLHALHRLPRETRSSPLRPAIGRCGLPAFNYPQSVLCEQLIGFRVSLIRWLLAPMEHP
ncbi:MAG: hypothetical protein ACRD88_16745 [Terriglobia bacterium]